MNSRWAPIALTLMSLTAMGLSTYIGLRLEPVIQRVERLDTEFSDYLTETRPVMREFYETKMVQKQMLINDERQIEELKGLRRDLDRLLNSDVRPSWLPKDWEERK